MFYFFKFLFLLIHIDQETVLNWFGIEDPKAYETRQAIEAGFEFEFDVIETSTNLSVETLRLIIEGLWEKVQDGLTLADIENILFFILFIRFAILAIRYNLKTSFYITCIGLFAGYLWYRHLIDLIVMYRAVLLQLPFLQNLGMDAIQLNSLHRQMTLADIKLGENAHWYNPGQVLYYGLAKGIIDVDPETSFRYYMDPISMIVSKFQEPIKSKIIPLYYNVYNNAIPKILDICGRYWEQLSGIAAYAIITRIGKRYCPYLVRWHWTFLLIISLVEQILVYFIYRVYYFQTYVLIPQTEAEGIFEAFIDKNIILQVEFLNAVIACIVVLHIAFVLFGLLHAICGQYFYIPFFVENAELHIGPRPKKSIYSGGNTAWQDPEEKEKNLKRLFPKLWYGWFGRGTSNNFKIVTKFRKFLKKILKKLKRQFRR